MFRTLRAVGIATAIFAASAVAASAAVVTIVDSSTQGVGNQAALFGADYNGSTPIGASWSGSAPVVTPPPGNQGGSYQSPFNNTTLVDSQSYFSVGGTSGTNGGVSPMTLTFSTPQTVFNILWGSIDNYNTIEFFDGVNSVLSLTGTNLALTYGLASSFANNYEIVALVNFDFGDIQRQFTSVKFTSTSAAFEFALAAVPVPAAIWLMLSAIGGLGGLGFLSRRNKGAAAA